MMRVSLWVLLALASSAPAWAQGASPQEVDPRATASIAGRVVSATDGLPILGATLRLVSFDVMRVARSTTTDAEGRFEFQHLVPGRYQLEARADRHVTSMLGGRRPPDRGRQIDLRDKEAFTAADFELQGTGSIAGFVVDEFGDPAPGISMQLSEARFVAGLTRLFPIASSPTLSDDKGQFRIDGLGPGEYYLVALTGAFAASDETGGFAATYFPGTDDVSGALPVRVGAAEHVTNLSFALVPASMSTLSGRIVDEQGQPVARSTVWFSPTEAANSFQQFMMARGATGPDGRFSFRNVAPGQYTIQAFGRPAGGGNLGRAPFGWHTITVRDGEPVDVEMMVRTGATLRGRIRFEGSAPRPTPDEVRVVGRSIEFTSAPIAGGPSPRETFDDWTFEVGAMSGLRVIRTDNTSSVWTLKAVLHDERDVTDMPFDFRNGEDVEGVEVVLTDSAATLTGTVRDEAGQPTTDYAVAVFSSDPSHWTFPSRFIQLARPNQTGEFRAPGLPPGEYLAVALTALDEKRWEDPDYLTELRGLATLITLSAGQEIAIALDIVR